MMRKDAPVDDCEKNESAFMVAATRDAASPRESIWQVWLNLWIALLFSGAVFAGMSLARGVMPWSGVLAAMPYGSIVVAMLAMLRIEDDLGGAPARLLIKLTGLTLVGFAIGWGVASPFADKIAAHLIG
jgi:hypothetical protein